MATEWTEADTAALLHAAAFLVGENHPGQDVALRAAAEIERLRKDLAHSQADKECYDCIATKADSEAIRVLKESGYIIPHGTNFSECCTEILPAEYSKVTAALAAEREKVERLLARVEHWFASNIREAKGYRQPSPFIAWLERGREEIVGEERDK